MNLNLKQLIENYVKYLYLMEATPKPKGFFDLPPGFTKLTKIELEQNAETDEKEDKKERIKRNASHSDYSNMEQNAFEDEIEELRETPEYEGLDSFVNFKLDNDEFEFTAAELQAIARNLQSALNGRKVYVANSELVKQLKIHLETELGLKFVPRQPVKGFRGSMSSAHGSNPFAGTGGGGSGFSSDGLKLGTGPGAIGGKRSWGSSPTDLTMGSRKGKK